MKEARYLFRLAPSIKYHPSDHTLLLARVRELAAPYKGKAINLRVSPAAIEFDLFFSSEMDPEVFKSVLKPLGEVITCKRLDIPPPPVIAQQVIDEAKQLFNEHRFWEVHEVLEGLWKELAGSEKQLVQGLILVAASLVHHQKDENPVMWKMLSDALRRLEEQPADYYGWDIRQFRDDFRQALASRTLIIPTAK